MVNKKINFSVMWAILCKTASVDQQSNLLSLFNIVEELTLVNNQVPLGPNSPLISYRENTKFKMDSTLVIMLERESLENNATPDPSMEIKLVGSLDEELMRIEFPVKFEEGKKRLRTIIQSDMFVVKNSGTYKYVVSIRSKPDEAFQEATQIPVEVKIFS